MVSRSGGPAERVSVASDESEATGSSDLAAIDGDGSRVVFVSAASNLVNNDTNGVDDVFLRDLTVGKTERISVGTQIPEANGGSSSASISQDGTIVAFEFQASNLSGTDDNFARDVFVRDLESKVTKILSFIDGEVGDWFSSGPSLDDDGSLVAFTSGAENLVTPDNNGSWSDVLLRDQRTVPFLPPISNLWRLRRGSGSGERRPCQGDPVNRLTVAYRPL